MPADFAASFPASGFLFWVLHLFSSWILCIWRCQPLRLCAASSYLSSNPSNLISIGAFLIWRDPRLFPSVFISPRNYNWRSHARLCKLVSFLTRAPYLLSVESSTTKSSWSLPIRCLCSSSYDKPNGLASVLSKSLSFWLSISNVHTTIILLDINLTISLE